MTYAEYLSTMTVKTLVEVAKQMGLSHSGLKKAELVAKLDEYISGWHVIALDMDAEYSAEVVRLIAENETYVPEFKGLTVRQRMDNYKVQNRGGRLTRRQQKRIAKKYAKALKKGFSLETVTGFAL